MIDSSIRVFLMVIRQVRMTSLEVRTSLAGLFSVCPGAALAGTQTTLPLDHWLTTRRFETKLRVDSVIPV
jgi:hypothetical protein